MLVYAHHMTDVLLQHLHVLKQQLSQWVNFMSSELGHDSKTD